MQKNCKKFQNAVAPDWNLKLTSLVYKLLFKENAVAPDWNLKLRMLMYSICLPKNAVAPDWNLKYLKGGEDLELRRMQSHQIGI